MDVRTITVDYDNISDLKRQITRLQERRKTLLRAVGAEQIVFDGSRHAVCKILPIFEGVLDSGIPLTDLGAQSVRAFYVYVHCNPLLPLSVLHSVKHLLLAKRFGLKFEPFYVGKGRDGRLYDTSRNDGYRKIKSRILGAGKEIIIRKVAQLLTEAEALALESKLMDVLGLRCHSGHGLLVNLDEGEDAIERRRAYPSGLYTRRVLTRNGVKMPPGGGNTQREWAVQFPLGERHLVNQNDPQRV